MASAARALRFPYLNHSLARIATHFLSRLYLEGPDGESVVIESDEPAALMIRRVEFDALLLSLAVGAGADVVCEADIVRRSECNDRVIARPVTAGSSRHLS